MALLDGGGCGLSSGADHVNQNGPMPEPAGFAYTIRKNGDIVITHDGRAAATLRGSAAEKFLIRAHTRDPQQLMARVTGNYKRANERRA